MTVTKLKPKEKTEIKHIETDYKPIKAIHNRICNWFDTLRSGFNSLTERYGINGRDCCGYAVGYGIGSVFR